MVGVVAGRTVDQRWTLWRWLALLNALDVITTAMILSRGGIESNPILAPLVDNMMTIVVMKAMVLAVVAALLCPCRGSRRVELALAGTAGLYLAVVSWNTAVLAVI